MQDYPNPVAPSKRLRAELRQIRQAAGYTQSAAATALGWPGLRLADIEAGLAAISEDELRVVLSLYQVSDGAYPGDLGALAQAATASVWWAGYHDVMPSRAFLRLIERESAASAIRWFQPVFVPGLLQTEAYARQVIRLCALDASEERVESLTRLRLRRQDAVARCPAMLFVLDEAALRRRVGDADIMRRQLLHLIELAGRPGLTIEVIPFTAGLHPAMQASFGHLEFPDPADRDALFLETPSGDSLVTDDEDRICAYAEFFRQLRLRSAGTGTAELIRAQAADLS